MRGLLLTAAAAALVLTVACDAPAPLDISDRTKIQHAAVPGTGNPAIDALLQTFNNQVVACANNDEIARETASRFALIAAILRFTPTPEQKLNALVQALLLQIEHGRERGAISEACANTLTNTLTQITNT